MEKPLDDRSAAPLGEVRANATQAGRVNQKMRTRRALIDAASEALESGAAITLADVADRALVSRTTAYRYFKSVEVLIEEVFFDQDWPTIDAVLGTAGDDPTTRILQVEEAVNDTLLAHERAMRVIVRNALDTSLESPDDDPTPRPGRRNALIAAAVEPLQGRLDPDRLDLLRHALAITIGTEAVIAARDTCGLDATQTRTVTRWATEAIIAHALATAGDDGDAPGQAGGSA